MPDRLGALLRPTVVRHTLVALVGFGLLYLLIVGLDDYRNTQLAPIAYTACAVAGLTLLIGHSGQISLGHGAFMMTGGYTVALLLEHWTPTNHPNLVLVLYLAASVVVAAIFGAIVGVAAARLRGPYLAGATLALAVGLPSLASYEHLRDQLGGSHGVTINQPLQPSSFDYYRWQSFVCCAGAVVVLWFIANVMRSRVGRSMRAVRDDEVAAALCGLSVARVQVLAFVISAGAAGMGGALLAFVNGNAGSDAFGLQLSLALLAAVVIGGLGSLTGAALGTFLVIMLNNSWAQDLANALSVNSAKVTDNLPLLIYGVLLALSMLVLPGGLASLVRLATRAAAARFGPTWRKSGA